MAILPACQTGTGPDHAGRRVVIVAAEGASWKALSAMDQGTVPHLADMTVTGSAGVVRADPPLSPAAVWTTVATGRSRDAHGIAFDAMKASEERMLRPVTADRRRVPAVWSIAGARDVTVGVAGWPATWPAEPVKGFLIADAYEPGSPEQRGDFHPPGALGSGGEGGDAQMLADALRGAAESDPLVQMAFDDDLTTLSQAMALQRVHQPRLLMIRLRSIDVVSHRFWQYHEPGYLSVAASRGETMSEERARRMAEAVTSAYRFVDDCIGRLQSRLPPETALLIVSGWGMRGVGPTDYLHVDLGGLMARLAESGVGSATRFFALEDTGRVPRGLYLQEARGGTAPSDAEAVREVAAALRSLKAADGTPLFRLAAPVREPAPDGPVIELMENMEIDPESRLRLGGHEVPVRDLFRRYGDDFAIHDPDGLLLAKGDGVARTRGWTAHVLDIAPTVLALLGLPLAQDMPGHPIEPLLAGTAWKDRAPVATYDGIAPPPAPARRDAARARRETQRLEASGHLR
ncbi:MAG: alkaline phosphatase family protein [Candidatus Polarisedimenticolia bacterium]